MAGCTRALFWSALTVLLISAGTAVHATEPTTKELAFLARVVAFPDPGIEFSVGFDRETFMPVRRQPGLPLDEAALIERIKNVDGEDAGENVVLGDAWLRLGHGHTARRWYQRALGANGRDRQQNGPSLDSSLLSGRILMKLGRRDAAVRVYAEAAQAFPGQAAAAYRLCQALLAGGNLKAARRVSLTMLETHPGSLESYVSYATVEFLSALAKPDGQPLVDRLDLAPLETTQRKYPMLKAPLAIMKAYVLGAAVLMEALADQADGAVPWRGVGAGHPHDSRLARMQANVDIWTADSTAPSAAWAVAAIMAMIKGSEKKLAGATRQLVARSDNAIDFERSLFVLVLMDRPGTAIGLVTAESVRFPAPKYQRLLAWLNDKAGDRTAARRIVATLSVHRAYRDVAEAVLALRNGDAGGAMAALDRAGNKPGSGVDMSYYGGIRAFLAGDRDTAREALSGSVRDPVTGPHARRLLGRLFTAMQ